MITDEDEYGASASGVTFTPTADTVPETLPQVPVHSVEAYEAWHRQATRMAVSLETLFQPNETEVEWPLAKKNKQNITTLTHIQQCLQANYIAPANSTIEQPHPEQPKYLPIEFAYVNLALIQEHLSGSAIAPVLVLGEAGVGKSVFSQYLAHMWAKNKLWGGAAGRFNLLFYLKLKSILPYSDQASFAQILSRECMEGIHLPPMNIIARWLSSKANTARILFILDGYDEVAEVANDHPALRMLLKQVFQYPYVMITSRPHHFSSIGVKPVEYFRLYRNIGFKQENIKKYIKKYFENTLDAEAKVCTLLSWLIQHPIAQSIAHIPLQLGMLCSVWQENHSDERLAEPTLSKLYETIVNQRKRTAARKMRNSSILYFQYAEKLLMKIAYHGMHGLEAANPTYKFTSAQTKDSLRMSIQPFLEHPIELVEEVIFMHALTLGFLKAERGSTSLSIPDNYYFVHLTYQEYYCARYIAYLFSSIKEKNSQEEIDALIAQHKFSERYERVWWFVSGLLGLQLQEIKRRYQLTVPPTNEDRQAEKQARQALVYFFDNFQQSHWDIVGGYELGLLARCLEESGENFSIVNEELHYRMTNALQLINRIVNIFPGISLEQLYAMPFLAQLKLSPNVQAMLGISLTDAYTCWAQRIELCIDAAIRLTTTEQAQNALAKLNTSRKPRKAIATLGTLKKKIPDILRDEVIRSLLKEALKNSMASSEAIEVLDSLKEIISEGLREEIGRNLLAALNRPGWDVHTAAIKSLSSLKEMIPEISRDKIVKDFLAELSDLDMAHDAINGLGALKETISEILREEVVRHLLTALNKPATNCEAIKALGVLKDTIPENLRETVINALIDIGLSGGEGRHWFSVCIETIQAVVTLKETIPLNLREAIISHLMALSRNLIEDNIISSRAIRALGDLGEIIPSDFRNAVVNYLLAVLNDSAPKMRILAHDAIDALGALKETIPENLRGAVVNQLLGALKDLRVIIQCSASAALGALKETIPKSLREAVIYNLLSLSRLNPALNHASEVSSDAIKALSALKEIISEATILGKKESSHLKKQNIDTETVRKPTEVPATTPAIINVSGLDNNCGLYALALATRFAIPDENARWQFLPDIVKTIHYEEVTPSANQERLRVLGKGLRTLLVSAMAVDEMYKARRMESFIQLCLGSTVADMEAFQQSSAEFITEIHLKLTTASENITPQFDELVLPSSSEVDTFLAGILTQLQEPPKHMNMGARLNACLKSHIPPLQSLYRVCVLFKTVWEQVNEAHGSSDARQTAKEQAIEWFFQKAHEMMQSVSDGQERWHYLSALGECYACFMGNSFIESTKALFTHLHVVAHWEKIYADYLNYIEIQEVMLSADELACLARAWQINLDIHFDTGAEVSLVMGFNRKIVLTNPSQIHWQIWSERENHFRTNVIRESDISKQLAVFSPRIVVSKDLRELVTLNLLAILNDSGTSFVILTIIEAFIALGEIIPKHVCTDVIKGLLAASSHVTGHAFLSNEG